MLPLLCCSRQNVLDLQAAYFMPVEHDRNFAIGRNDLAVLVVKLFGWAGGAREQFALAVNDVYDPIDRNACAGINAFLPAAVFLERRVCDLYHERGLPG